MLENFAHFVVLAQFLRTNPDPLAHQHRIVADLFAGLNFQPVQQLFNHQVDHLIEVHKK